MDSSQESAIEAIEPELISQLPYVDFINFLIQSASGFFLKATEVFPIRGDLNATLAEKIRRLMKLLGSKPGGWEILISYLRGNGLKKLAQKLVLLRQGQQADHLLERCLLSLFRYYQNNRYVVESIHGTADNIFSSSPVETRNIHHYLEKAAFHLRKERKHVGLIHLPERDPMFFVLAPLDPDVSVLDSAAGCLLNSKTVTEVPWSDSNVLLIYTVKNHQLLRTENSEIRSVQMQLFSDGEWLERFACAKTWPFSQIINSNKSVLPPKLSFTPLNAVKPKVAPKPKSLSLDTDIHLIGIINDSDQRLEESMLIAPNIEIIDFSNTKLEKLRFPESLKATLTSLVLYNVPNLHKFEADIFELKELK